MFKKIAAFTVRAEADPEFRKKLLEDIRASWGDPKKASFNSQMIRALYAAKEKKDSKKDSKKDDKKGGNQITLSKEEEKALAEVWKERGKKKKKEK